MKKKIETRIIKKYQNRRLYDTATSTYIVLEDIKQIIVDGELVKVIDVKSEQEVTRSVLLQIILEEEVNGIPMFSDEFLFQIIRFYGKAFQPSLSPFLEGYIQQQTPQIEASIKEYVDNSTNALLKMQEHLQHQTENMLSYMQIPFTGQKKGK